METREVEQESLAIVAEANALTVSSDEENRAAGEFVLRCARALKKLDEVFDPIIAAQHAAHKASVAQKKKYADPIKQAKDRAGSAIGAYARKVEAAAREEERRRLEAAKKAEEERRIAEAEELEKSGQHEEAAAVIEKPIAVSVAPVTPLVQPKGISTRTDWDFRILDASKIRREYLMADEVKMRRVVRAMGPDAAAMIGEGAVEIIEKTIVAAATR
jgi:hypothetical protein